jgi:hypothetical protein
MSRQQVDTVRFAIRQTWRTRRYRTIYKVNRRSNGNGPAHVGRDAVEH